jgi:uncharacterized cupredoxin-like copper-binding protein
MTRRSSILPLRRLVGALLLAGVAVFGLACGGGDEQSSESTAARATPSTSTDTVEVTMKDFVYEPSSITVPAGQKVTLQFTNAGSVEHYFVVGDTVASGADGFNQNLFAGVPIEKNKETEGGEKEDHGEEEEHHAHEFELPPGGSGTLTFTLPPEKTGTYTIACFETTGNKSHHEMGMEGTLTVTSADRN